MNETTLHETPAGVFAAIEVCPHRTSGETFARCRLAASLVGNEGLCGVHESLCGACMKKGTPDLTSPNPYLASVAYKACDARAKAAANANDKAGWFHFVGLAHFFRDRLQRVTPKERPPTNEQPAERPRLCEYIGSVVARRPCNCPLKHVYECRRFKDSVGLVQLQVMPIDQCALCPAYVDPEADDADESGPPEATT
jgi:hypothetical protein